MYRLEMTLRRNFQKLRRSPGVRYESVGRGFESLPSHQEKPEHVCVLVFLFVSTMEGGSNRAAARSAASKATVRLCLARGFQRIGMSTVEAVKSKDFMAFLFFRQSLHTFAHLLHTLQKSHELFASLAQRVFRCTKNKLVGARPLHLACARPFCRLKAPRGLACALKTQTAIILKIVII